MNLCKKRKFNLEVRRRILKVFQNENLGILKAFIRAARMGLKEFISIVVW